MQYQKQLRLQEARQLMLNENVDAGNAGGLVGYESASQFSREYSRLFGAPPQQDVRRMRIEQLIRYERKEYELVDSSDLGAGHRDGRKV